MIYFARFRDAEPVKIGYSRNLHGRLSGLRRKFQVDLSFIRTMEGRLFTERWLHVYFADRHIWGEWFRFHPDMLTVIPPVERLDSIVERSITVTGQPFYADRLFVDFRPSTTGGYLEGHSMRGLSPQIAGTENRGPRIEIGRTA